MSERAEIAVSRTTDDLSEPLTYGVEAYTAPNYARAEHARLWRKVWQQAGRLEEIPDVGSYLTYDIHDDSVLIVRSAPDSIRAFYNVCSHRGRRLVDTPAGAKRGVAANKNNSSAASTVGRTTWKAIATTCLTRKIGTARSTSARASARSKWIPGVDGFGSTSIPQLRVLEVLPSSRQRACWIP